MTMLSVIKKNARAICYVGLAFLATNLTGCSNTKNELPPAARAATTAPANTQEAPNAHVKKNTKTIQDYKVPQMVGGHYGPSDKAVITPGAGKTQRIADGSVIFFQGGVVDATITAFYDKDNTVTQVVTTINNKTNGCVVTYTESQENSSITCKSPNAVKIYSVSKTETDWRKAYKINGKPAEPLDCDFADRLLHDLQVIRNPLLNEVGITPATSFIANPVAQFAAALTPVKGASTAKNGFGFGTGA